MGSLCALHAARCLCWLVPPMLSKRGPPQFLNKEDVRMQGNAKGLRQHKISPWEWCFTLCQNIYILLKKFQSQINLPCKWNPVFLRQEVCQRLTWSKKAFCVQSTVGGIRCSFLQTNLLSQNGFVRSQMNLSLRQLHQVNFCIQTCCQHDALLLLIVKIIIFKVIGNDKHIWWLWCQ